MSKTVAYRMESFSGGINLQFDPSKIGDDEYPLLVNGRVRRNVVDPIQLPQELAGQLVTGNYQGLYAVGTYLLAFVDGEAYYKDIADSNSVAFTKVLGGFQLDPDVERIYGDLIPASTLNYIRKLANDTNVKEGVNFTSFTLPSPSAFVAQDGINQPWVIFQDGTSRETQNWQGWSLSNREYVPIGLFPMFYPGNGILYCAGKDTNGKLNQILRSVSGRPLDYMVVIDTNGDKTEMIGGDAASVSYRADYNSLTSLVNINSTDNSFFVSTNYNSYLVTPTNGQGDPFAEPVFSSQFLFNTGPLNNFSVLEVLGDTLLIDQKGIVSFNAAQQIKFRGNNAPFSAKINSLFEYRPNAYVTQTFTCAGKLNNYAYFALNTIYGPSVLVYDELGQKFVSVDLWELGDEVYVKQFAVINTANVSRLFFITTDNKLYEAFGSETTATCRIYLGEWSAASLSGQLKIYGVSASFQQISTQGTATVSLYVDQVKCDDDTQDLLANFIPATLPVTIPFDNQPNQVTTPLSFGFDDTSLQGKNVGVMLSWNCVASLESIEVVGEDFSVVTSPQQQAQDSR